MKAEKAAETLGAKKDATKGWKAYCPIHQKAAFWDPALAEPGDDPDLMILRDGDDGYPQYECQSRHCEIDNFREFMTALRDRLGSDLVRPAKRSSESEAARPKVPLPTPEEIDRWHERLMSGSDKVSGDLLSYLREEVGLSVDLIKELRLGRQRISDENGTELRYRVYLVVPVFGPEGQLRNVVRWNPLDGSKGKLLWTGQPASEHLLGAERVSGYPDDDRIALAEGVSDYVAGVAAGLPVVATIVGAGNELKADGDLIVLAGRQVATCYDNDDAGRNGAPRTARCLHDAAAAPYVADISPLAPDKGGDLRDALREHGADAVRRIVEQAEPWQYISPGAEKRLENLLDNDIAQRRFTAIKARERAEATGGIHLFDGATFMLDVPATPDPIWGKPDAVLWPENQGFLLVGGDGSGKTTMIQQVCLAAIGLRSEVLGFPVADDGKLTVYLAMDRRDQIARSFNRMVTDEDRAVLTERVRIWGAPLPINPLESPYALAEWLINTFGSDIGKVVVDSYKDIAPGLSDDRVGSEINIAVQEVLARGIQWAGLHHQRKPNGDSRQHVESLHDVYGSRWLVAGMGSVFYLAGDAGARQVEMRHLKPAIGEPLAPMLIVHDHARGRSVRITLERGPIEILAANGTEGATIGMIALGMYGQDNQATRKRVKRQLKQLVDSERVVCVKGAAGGSGGTRPDRWFLVEEAP